MIDALPRDVRACVLPGRITRPDKHLSTNRIRDGPDVRTVQKRAGHSSVNRTMEYTDWLRAHDNRSGALANLEDNRYAAAV